MGDNEWTAPHRAARGGYEAVVPLLSRREPMPIAKANESRTALHRAARNRHEAVVRLLVKERAGVNVKANDGRTALS
jgi:ankyrin repeat protein